MAAVVVESHTAVVAAAGRIEVEEMYPVAVAVAAGLLDDQPVAATIAVRVGVDAGVDAGVGPW